MRKRQIIYSGVYLVLLLLAVVLSGWFGLHTRYATAALQSALDQKTTPSPLTFGQIDLGPGIHEGTLYDVVILNRSGQPVLKAARVHYRTRYDELRFRKRDLAVPIRELTIQDFELTLEWNQWGKLELVEAFRKRSFGLSLKKPPPLSMDVNLTNINLLNGTLHLVWPTFGFSFRGISTRGTVRARPDDLSIHVPHLGSPEGTMWIRNVAPPVRARLEAAIPSTQMATQAPAGLRIPFSDVSIDDFEWAGEGFKTRLSLTVSGDAPIRASGSMDFPRDKGVGHKLTVSVDLPAPMARTLTRGKVDGSARLAVSTNAIDWDGTLRVDDLWLERAKLGALGVSDFRVKPAEFDTRDGKWVFSSRQSASGLHIGGNTLADVKADVRMQVNWKGWTLASLLNEVKNHKLRFASHLLFGKLPSADLSVESARAASVKAGTKELGALNLDGLKVRVNLPSVSGRLKRLTVGEASRVSASLDPGIFGMTLTVNLEKIPTSVVRKLLVNSDKYTIPNAELVSGRVVYRAPRTKPWAFSLKKVELTPVQ